MDYTEIQTQCKSNIATLISQFGEIINPNRIIEDFCAEFQSLYQLAKPDLRENVPLLAEKKLKERYREAREAYGAGPLPNNPNPLIKPFL